MVLAQLFFVAIWHNAVCLSFMDLTYELKYQILKAHVCSSIFIFIWYKCSSKFNNANSETL